MRKIISLFIILSLVFAFVLPANALASVTGKTIAIDPGHGGSDWGTTQCDLLPEKVVTLDISERLRGLLEVNGARVVMTRTTDINLGNTERASIANVENADVLVSVHLNGSTDNSMNYTQGLYGKRGKDLDFTKVIHNAQLNALTPIADGGVTNFASGVLLKSNMPATITESVFLSNTLECATMSNGTTRQDQIAQSIYTGLHNWFAQQTDGSDGGNTSPGNGKGKPSK